MNVAFYFNVEGWIWYLIAVNIALCVIRFTVWMIEEGERMKSLTPEELEAERQIAINHGLSDEDDLEY